MRTAEKESPLRAESDFAPAYTEQSQPVRGAFRRLAICLGLTLPLLGLEALRLSAVAPLHSVGLNLLEPLLAAPVVLWGGLPIFAALWLGQGRLGNAGLAGFCLMLGWICAIGEFCRQILFGWAGSAGFAACAALVCCQLGAQAADARAGFDGAETVSAGSLARLSRRWPTWLGLMGLLGFAAWFWLLNPGDWALALRHGVALLLAASPAPILLAQALPRLFALRAAPGLGLDFRRPQALERLIHLDTFAADPRDLIGEAPAVPGLLLSLGDTAESDWLSWSAALATAAALPEAAGLQALCAARGLEPAPAPEVLGQPAGGCRGRIAGHELLLGGQALFQVQGYHFASLQKQLDQARIEGQNLLLVAVDGQLTGALGLKDRLSPDFAAELAALNTAGLQFVLLTTAHETTARAWARELGITRASAAVLPEQKAAEITSLQLQSHRVALLGTAADARALSKADLALYRNIGAPIPAQAELVFEGPAVSALLQALALSRRAARIRGQNLGIGASYYLLALALALSVPDPFAALALLLLAASLLLLANSLRVGRQGRTQ